MAVGEAGTSGYESKGQVQKDCAPLPGGEKLPIGQSRQLMPSVVKVFAAQAVQVVDATTDV